MPAPDLWRTAARLVPDPVGAPDAELLNRFHATRDEAAFELLVYRHGSLVWAACRRLLNDRHMAEDVFQAVFLALARRAGSIRRAESVPAWLHRVAVRAGTRLRRRSRPTLLADKLIDPSPGPADRAAATDLLAQLDAAVDRLPERLRRVFVACELRGDPLADVAARLGCPVGTVASRLGRARARLRDVLAARGVVAGSLAGLAASELVPAAVRAAAVRGAVEPAGVRPAVSALAVRAAPPRFRAAGLVATAVAGLVAAVALGMPADPPQAKERPVARPTAPAAPTDLQRMAGTWLAEAAEADMDRPLGRVWFSTFKITGDKFHIEKFFFHPKGLSGTFALDPTTTPKSVDLKINELDYAELGEPVKIPAGTLKGIYKLDGDRVTICFPLDADAKRPTEFKGGRRTVVLTLARAKADFHELPKEVTVTVLGPDGKPVPDATTFASSIWSEPPPGKDGRAEWKAYPGLRTGSNGTVKVPYEEIGRSFGASTADRKLIGLVRASPFALQTPALTVKLAPAVRVAGTIESDELKKAGLPVGWTNTQVYFGESRVASFMTTAGRFEFPLPPGDYVLETYGSDLDKKRVPITVPADRTKLDLPPIKPAALILPLLKGKPALELKDVVGWKGEKVSLAELKGKVVLLEFWGYWCGPCVASMPVLLELHDKFKDKGLAIVGIHLDIDGEVNAAGKLDEKLVDIRKKLWKDRDLPFPVALCSGKEIEVNGQMRRGGPALQYGIVSYPTTVLIDREGKVVGTFQARNPAEAVREMERLLATK